VGYSIRIGQEKGLFTRRVEKIFSPKAPIFPYEYMDNRQSNQSFISYTGWTDFLESAGLQVAMNDHGLYLVTPALFETFNQCLRAYVSTGTRLKAGYGNNNDAVAARLGWFSFWLKRSLDDCSRPRIEMA
jgi:hypothetical protein